MLLKTSVLGVSGTIAPVIPFLERHLLLCNSLLMESVMTAAEVGMPETAVKTDQRSMRRFNMQLPVKVVGAGTAAAASTRDVSAKGIFLFLDHDIAPDTAIEFTLTLPPEVTMTQSMRVKCSGTVIRVERDHRGKFGVAALVHHYRFLDSNEV